MILRIPGKRSSLWPLLVLAEIIAIGGQCGLAKGQILHAVGDRPSFEVATIKPWKRGASPNPPTDGTSAPAKVMKVAPVGAGEQMTSRVHLILPAALLIASAYNLPVGSENRLLRGPNWLRVDTDQYEIEARIDDTLFAAMKKMPSAQQRDQVALMEQSLLADRFKLKVHFEKVEMPIYALLVAKGGAKLTRAQDGATTTLSTARDVQGIKMTATAVTLDQLVLSPFLTGASGRVVLNQTGLKGAYDFTLKWEPEEMATSDAAAKMAAGAPSLFTAIQEQLGLKLAAAKAPVEIIVVDRIERPSPN